MDQAEQLRIIKANNQIRPTARVITVTSGKGGVGKSNMSINLAIQFRKMGKRVIILDADFGLANIEIMFGAIPKHNLCDLVYEGKSISDIITWGPMEVGFISGGSGIAGMSNLGKDALTCIIQNLAELDALTDIIIVDTGAGISDSVLEFLVASGEVLLVTTPEPTSITDSYSLLKALYRHPRFQEDFTKVMMVANRVSNIKEGQVLFDKLNAHDLYGMCTSGSSGHAGGDAAGTRIHTESGSKGKPGLSENRRENVRKRRRYSAGAAAQARNGSIFFSHYRYEKWSYKTVQIREV